MIITLFFNQILVTGGAFAEASEKGVLGVTLTKIFCDSEICNFGVQGFVQQYVRHFEVAMDIVVFMEALKTLQDV